MNPLNTFDKNKIILVPPGVLDTAKNLFDDGLRFKRNDFLSILYATREFCSSVISYYENTSNKGKERR